MFRAAYRRIDAEPAPGGGRPRRAKVGLVLGAGAARGWSHIGALRELDALGLKLDVIVGSSIGTLVGGCYAAGRLDMLDALARSPGTWPLGLLVYWQRPDRRPAASNEARGGAWRASDRGSADPIRRCRHRDRRRTRDLAPARAPRRRDPRFLCVAWRIRTGEGRRTLAVRRRERQSRAGQRRARAWRRARDRAQHYQRSRWPRRRHSGPFRPTGRPVFG